MADKTNKGVSIDDVVALRKATTASMFGVDASALDQRKELETKIQDTMSRIASVYRRETGANVMEFFSRMEMLKGGGRRGRNGKKINVNDLVENADTGVVNDIFYGEKDRIQLYYSFDQIYDLIPQMAMALDTFVDNIISPDDFTKTSFNIDFTGPGADDAKKKEITKRLDGIKKKYKLEQIQPKIIRQTMRKGDFFVAVLRYDEEIGKLLKEESAFRDDKVIHELMYESVTALGKVAITDGERMLLTEFAALEEIAHGRKPDKEAISLEWDNEVRRMIDEQVVVSRNPETLLAEAIEDARETIEKDMSKAKNAEDKSKADPSLSGSVLRLLDSTRVVKLTIDNVDYGYYYVDQIGANTQFGTTHSLGSNRFRDLITSSIGTIDPIADQVKTAKLRLVASIFAKNVAEKIDRKFVRDNPEFKNVIYGMLKSATDVGQRVRITYIPPDRMVHFRSEGDGIYGRSIYTPILFTAKLYLASLISTLMQKLVRAPERRIFYIETGLDEDTPGAIQSFVKSIKSKEFKVSDLGDITSALNSVGTFNDLYVPMQNGEKTIEVDSLPGTETSIENEFLDYLRRSMISGIGIPAAFLGYSDEVEFARSLTMQNGRFTRSVIAWQATLAEQFTQMIRMLYEAEYSAEKEYDDTEKDSINVKFPRPMTLLSTAMNDMVNNVNTILDFVTNALVGDSPDVDPEVKRIFRVESLKKLMPGIDWESYKEILEDAQVQRNVNVLKKATIGKIDEKKELPPEEDELGGEGGEDMPM